MEETKEIMEKEASELSLMNEESKDAEVLYEDVSRRKENTKHFRMKNGNFMAVVYDEPVHKLNEKTGKLEEIKEEFTETEEEYEASTKHFKVKLPKKEGRRKFVTVEKDGKSVSFRFASGKPTHTKRPEAKMHSVKKHYWEHKKYPTVKYEKVDNITSLEYEVNDGGIKENIVLTKCPETSTFKFDMMCNGLTPKLSENKKRVILLDENEEAVMVIPPANMTDDNGVYSEDIHYELCETENGTTLEMVVENDWLSAYERKYPVTIDPRINILGNSSSSDKMLEVCSNGSVVNYGTSRRVGIDENGSMRRIYMKINLPEDISHERIISANLLMRKESASGSGRKFSIYALRCAGTFSEITWGNQPRRYESDKVGEFIGGCSAVNADVSADLTNAVKTWLKTSPEEADYYAILVKKDDELGTMESALPACDCDGSDGDSSGANYVRLCSETALNDAHKPQLMIKYHSGDVYGDHQKFHTFEMGRAGTGSINLFTGKMSFAHGDANAEGIPLPLSVSHLYRKEYVNDAKSDIYGKGWRLSVEQSVSMGGEESNVIATYTDAQGKKHYFTKNDRNYVTDEDGLGFTFVEDCDGYPYAISDEKQNLMYFDQQGNMAKLKDSNGNASYLMYDEGKLRTLMVSSPVTNDNVTTNLETLVAMFDYDSNGRLSKVIDADGRETIYSYGDTNGCLMSIQYPAQNGEILKTLFTYDSENRLNSIKDYSGTKYTLTYNDDDMVTALSSVGSKTVTDSSVNDVTEKTDDTISFEYRASSTAIKSAKTNIKNVFNLDENGREISSYQDLSCLSNEFKSMITPTTLAEVSGYAPVHYNSQGYKIGKYRSLSVTLNRDADAERNYISNGLFKDVNNKLPLNWTTSDSTFIEMSSESYLDEANAVHFKETFMNEPKWISQTVSLRGYEFKGNVLVASAWAKARGQRISFVEDTSPKFRLTLTVTYPNGTSDEYFRNFDCACEDWQYVAIPFVLKKNNTIANATVKMDYSDNLGECYVTNIRLVEANGIITTNEYTLYEDTICTKNVMGVEKIIKTKVTKEDDVLVTKDYLDDKSDLVFNCTTYKGDDEHQYHTYYEYDENHNVTKTKDYRGMVIEYEYKDGKQIRKKTYHESTPNNYMYSEYEYGNVNSEGLYVNKESDPRYKVNGEVLKTETTYDQSRNILLNKKEVNGQETNYSYDDKTDDLESISSTVNSTTSSNTFSYRCGYLTKVAHNGFDFKFDFDEFGREKAVRIADECIFEKEYNDGAKESIKTIYNKGGVNEHTAEVFSDIFGNVIEQKFDGSSMTTVTYDSAGKARSVVDKIRNISYNYFYNVDGEVEKVEKYNTSTGTLISTDQFIYDSCDRITSKIYGDVGHTYQPIYEKDSNGIIYPDNEVIGVTLINHFKDEVEKDGLRRAFRKKFSTINGGTSSILFTDTFDYVITPHINNGIIETEFVSSVSSSVSGANSGTTSWNYTYDKSGNLETVSNGTTLVLKYYYDGLNRLVREDNKSLNKTYVWSYDVGGNITQKKVYPYTADINLGTATETYAYTYKTNGWKDQLASYNGKACEYDVFGNPTKYLGKTLEWSRIKLLTKFDTTTFEYGANGIRCKKNNTAYTLDGNRILKETDSNKTLIYYYGGSGVAGFNYNGTDYYFRKNIQGDITEIYTSTGALVASYLYDAWGNHKVLDANGVVNTFDTFIGNINPFRYRGYYYDVETGLYYLQTRYYDPETGRFINSDTTDVLENAKYDINGLNLYAYCDNNPVSGRDDEGNMSFWKKLAIAAAVVVAVAVVAAVVAAATAATGGAAGAALCAVTSTFVGAAKGAVIGAVTGAISGAATGAVQGAVEGYRETGTFEGTIRGMGRGAVKGAVEGAQDGLLSGMVMGGIGGAMNPSFCFVAGTTVLTTLGKKAIETIQIGDIIPCVDHITGEAAEKKVISTSVNKVNRIVELDIDGEIIKCTESHPFQVKDRGWVDACNLKPGDIVYTKDWNTATIKSVNLLELDESVEVFNFEVEDYHTYFIGDSAILVHNLNCHTQRGLDRQRGAKMNNTTRYKMNGHTRVPDYIHKNSNQVIDVIGEAKSVKYLTKSPQLVDIFTYGKQNGCKMFLKVEKWTKISDPLRSFLNTMGVAINIF